MNKDTIQGNWEQVKGQAKQYFAKVGDTNLKLLAEGKAQEFEGAVQEAYGKSKDEAKKYIREFEESCGYGSSDNKAA